MSDTYTDYIEFDDTNEDCPIKRLGCMVCNILIGQREVKKSTGKYRLKHFTNVRRPRVWLEDGTYADLLICADCESKVTDFKRMNKTIHQGWMKETNWKFLTSRNIKNKEAKKKRLNLNPNDPIPLKYFKALFKGKRILRKGDK